MYLYGMEFTLLTDHKPLETIYSTSSRNSARIERCVLRLEPYKLRVQYVPGKQNLADSFSQLVDMGVVMMMLRNLFVLWQDWHLLLQRK